MESEEKWCLLSLERDNFSCYYNYIIENKKIIRGGDVTEPSSL